MSSKVTMIPDNINQKKTRTFEVKIYVPDERKRHRDCHVMDCCPTQIYVHVPYRQSIIVMNACLEWNDTY
jgi:ferredoxin-like protein FixX